MASNNNNNDRANNFSHISSRPPKAQLPPQKIFLNTISATPPHQVHQFRVNASEKEESSVIAPSSSTSLSASNVVSEYDYTSMGYKLLDLNLTPPSETHQDSPSPALHDAEKVQECNLQSPEENNTSMLQDESFKYEMERNGNNLERGESEERREIKEVGGEREEGKSEIRFGALLDAVECAMEEYGSKPSEASKAEERNESAGKKRRRVQWKTGEEVEEVVAETVSTSPVVKSNRGRTQVLPYKYRDSVMEPLTHLSSRHSRSSSNNGSTRRRPEVINNNNK